MIAGHSDNQEARSTPASTESRWTTVRSFLGFAGVVSFASGIAELATDQDLPLGVKLTKIVGGGVCSLLPFYDLVENTEDSASVSDGRTHVGPITIQEHLVPVTEELQA